MSQNAGARLSIAVFVITVTTILNFLSLGPTNAWYLLWLAPLPLIIFSFYERHIPTFLAVVLSNILSGILCVSAYYANTLMPLLPLFLSIILNSICIASIIVVNAMFILRWRHWLAVLFLPTAIVTYNFITVLLAHGLLFPVDYAFTQYGYLPLIQLVSITGIWGICFLLNLVPNAIAFSWLFRKRKKMYLPIVVLTLAILGIALTFGYYRLYQPSTTQKISIGIAAHEYTDPDYISFSKQINDDVVNPEAAVTKYIQNVAVLARQGAQYALQPEYAVFLPFNSKIKQTVLYRIQEAAKKNKITIMFAFGEYDAVNHVIKENHAIIISAQGKIIGDYHKHHMVEFNEHSIQPQSALLQWPYKDEKLGIAICHDMDYINPAKKYGLNNTALLFVPAADFGVSKDAWWHARVALVQAIANGYSLARVGSYGYLTITDPYGKLIAIDTTKQQQNVFLIGNVPLGSGNTFYARHGNWFAWLNFFIAVLLILIAIERESK